MTYPLVFQNWPSDEFSNKGKEKRIFFNLLQAFPLDFKQEVQDNRDDSGRLLEK